MSTNDILIKLQQESKLTCFLPRLRSYETDKRAMYILPSLNKWLTQDMKTTRMLNDQARVVSHLAEFIKGNRIDDLDFMKLLKPSESNIWAMRVRGSKPQYRVFGAFIDFDCFFGSHFVNRDDIEEKNSWEEEVNFVKKMWAKIFDNTSIQRLSGSFQSLVSNGEERDKRKSKK